MKILEALRNGAVLGGLVLLETFLVKAHSDLTDWLAVALFGAVTVLLQVQ